MTEEMVVATRDVLIVHNDRRLGDAYRDVLQDAGYHCTVACNGEEALAEFRRSRPPLVITHLRLLGKYGGAELGIVLLRHLRRENPDAAVIVASAAFEREREALELGAFAFLHVPVAIEELLTTLDRALNDRRQHETSPPWPEKTTM